MVAPTREDALSDAIDASLRLSAYVAEMRGAPWELGAGDCCNATLDSLHALWTSMTDGMKNQFFLRCMHGRYLEQVGFAQFDVVAGAISGLKIWFIYLNFW